MIGLVLFVFNIIFVRAGNTFTVEANISASDTYTAIDVDKGAINFGKLKKGEASDYQTITINNTGTSNVFITLELQNYSQNIFNYIYVRKSPGSDSDYVRIGQFNFTLSRNDAQALRLVLNLTNYPSPIYQDINGHRANVLTRAMPLI
jgi:hypothetical protein